MAAAAVLVTSGKACVRASSLSGSVFLDMAFAMFLSVCATRKIGLPVAAEIPAEMRRLFLSDVQAFSCSMATWQLATLAIFWLHFGLLATLLATL